MTDATREAEIRRLFYREHWKIGTIAAQLGVHHDTVVRALNRPAAPVAPAPRAWGVDAYLPAVADILQRYPSLTATRLHQMIRERGYSGGVTQLRRAVVHHKLRPERKPDVFATRVPLPADEAQVDWATLGKVRVGRTERHVYALLVVLPYSRDCFVGFYHDMKLATLIEAHVDAFELFGGVPRRILYDNMKTAVVDRVGDAVRYHPTLLALSDYYGFEPVACRPRRPNEKGNVERRVRDLRDSMLAGTSYAARGQYIDAFAKWRTEVLHTRAHSRAGAETVGDAAARERSLLLPLPREPFAAFPLQGMRVGKQAWLTLDTNRYSVPPRYVGKTVSMLATHDRVCVLDNDKVVCTHKRSWDKHGDHQLDEHAKQIRELRPRSREHAGRARLITACPSAAQLLQRLIEEDEPTAHHTRVLNQLVETHGAEAVQGAIAQAIERGTPRAASVRMLLLGGGKAKGAALAAPIALPAHIADMDHTRTTHNLGDYDACTTPRRR